jgi:DNA polymerase I-like protein with 3'-5' exonuclease and polymerase domains
VNHSFWYFLKNKKDKFSVLNQGLGCYCFDVWLLQLLKLRPQLTGQFHDEFISELKQGFESEMTGLVKQAMYNANNILKLNVRLKFDIKFGQNYAEVH